MSAPQRWTALVLAGDRGPDDPIARLTGSPCKALAMVHGVPMLGRVLHALSASPRVGAIHLSGPRAEHLALWPELQARIQAGELGWTPPQGTAAASAIAALAALPADQPVLLTTADHALLQPSTVDAFLAGAEALTDADAALALAPLTIVQAAFPGVRRTALRLRGGPYCGCNLFALRTPRGRSAAAFWQRLETVRKRPAHIAGLLGVMAVARLADHGSGQHGDTDLGFYALPRFPSFALGIVAETPAALDIKRRRLVQIVNPGDEAITLEFGLDNGLTRYLDCHYYNGLTMTYSTRKGGIYQKVGVVFKASNPFFYDPTDRVLSFALIDSEGMEVPTPVATPVGASVLHQLATVGYIGSWQSSPFFRIFGPITDLVITNLTTGQKLDFTGHTIAAGDYYEIDTRYDYGTVVNAAGTSKAHELSDDSELTTFHLAPAVDGSASRDNLIEVVGSGATLVTLIQMTYTIMDSSL